MAQIQIHDGRVEQKAVEQVKDAADAGEKIAGILHARFAFEQRFDQVTHHSTDAQNNPENNGMLHRHAFHAVPQEMREHQAGDGGNEDGPGESFPGFARADARDHLVSPDQ